MLDNRYNLKNPEDYYLAFKDYMELQRLNERRVLLKQDIENPCYEYLSSGLAKWGVDINKLREA
jgi:hypothetical protein